MSFLHSFQKELQNLYKLLFFLKNNCLMIDFCKSFHCFKLLKPLTFDKLFMIQLNSKSIAIFVLFLGFFVVSCNQLNYTEINGFGGGIKTTKTKLEPKEVAQLKFSTDVKDDTSVLAIDASPKECS